MGILVQPSPADTRDALAAQALSILEKRCLQCHGDKVASSGLRLTSRELVLRGGTRGPAAKPGKSAESLLIAAVLHSGKLIMPPGPKLPEGEVEVLRTWVDRDLPWPQHAVQKSGAEWWAFLKPQRPVVPSVDGELPCSETMNFSRV